MFANGFTAELLVELVRVGLASAHAERMVADGRVTEVARMKISEAGWQNMVTDHQADRDLQARSVFSALQAYFRANSAPSPLWLGQSQPFSRGLRLPFAPNRR